MLTFSNVQMENFIDREDDSKMSFNEKSEDHPKEHVYFQCENNRRFEELMMDFILKNPKIMSLYFMFIIVHPLKNALVPHLMGKMYAKVQKDEPIKLLLYVVISLVVLLQVVWIFAEYVEVKMHPLLQKHLMDDIINHVFRINKENYNEQQVSSVINSISKFPITCYNFISQLKSYIIPSVIGLIIIGIYLIYLDFRMGLFYVAILLTAFVCLRFALRSCDDMSYLCDQKTTDLYSGIDDTIHNMSTILNFDKSQEEIEKIAEIFSSKNDVCGKTFNCTIVSKYCVIPLMIVFIIVSLTYFYKKLKNKEIEPSKFVTIIVVNFMIMNTVFNLTAVFKDMIIRMGIIKSSMRIFDECHIIPEYTETKPDYKTGIQFKHVDFSRFVEVPKNQENDKDVIKVHFIKDDAEILRKEKRIFVDLNVHFPKGKTTLIMGKIGSGKSTLINLISKNQTILRGNIFIDGKSIDRIDNLKQKVFYVPQTPILFNRTVYENVAYGIEDRVSKGDVIQKIKQVGLTSFFESLSSGVDTKVGLLGSHLSGGQRQMLWLIKTFFIKPDYIIMDEPTSAVDEDSKEIVHNLLKEVTRGKTVIMITHDEYLKQMSDRIIYMEDGVITHIDEKNKNKN